jgi:hypothetical protein
MLPLLRATGAVLSLLIAGVTVPPPGTEAPPWDFQTFRHLVDDPTGVGFDVPMQGFLLETRHFDAKTPDFRVKHSFTVSGPGGLEVTIDVFANPEGLDLARFLDTRLGFLRDGTEAVSRRTAGARRVPALFLERPKQPGSFAQPVALLALGSRVFRVTCNDEDDPRAALVFARILRTLDVPAGSK